MEYLVVTFWKLHVVLHSHTKDTGNYVQIIEKKFVQRSETEMNANACSFAFMHSVLFFPNFRFPLTSQSNKNFQWQYIWVVVRLSVQVYVTRD